MGWLLGPSASLEEVMKANLLSQVLLDNSSSPLRMALEKTSIASAPSPLCGLEDSNYEMCFICGLEGSEVEHADEFEKIVMDVLHDVANNGIAIDKLEAVLHQLELSQREIGGDGYPFGLQLILSGLSAAIHRSDPVALMNIDPVINSLREQIKDPEFIKNLVSDLLINNQHRVRLTLRPDAELSQRKEEAEKYRLSLIKASMTDDDKKAVITKTVELTQRQTQVDDPGVLPKVDLEDVPVDIVIPDAIDKMISGAESQVYAQGTNGIVYHEVVMDLPEMSDAETKLLPYYTACLTEVGCGDKDYLEMQALQSAVSGGIAGQSSIRGLINNEQETQGFYLFSGKALERNNTKLAQLMSDTLHSVRFDEFDRIKEIISQRRAARERGITGNGHVLAMTAASAGMCPVAKLSHQFGGLEGIRIIKSLDDANITGNAVEKLADQFAGIHKKIISSSRRYMMVAEAEKLDSLSSDFETIWTSQEQINSQKPFSLEAIKEPVQEMWVTNTQVNFCAKAYPTVTASHEDAAALSVLAGFMRNGYLHTAIREQGGAYGGGAGHDINIAAFRFYSYRDPRLTETLDDFDRAIDWVLDNKHEWRQVEEAILGVIGSLDKPGSPSGEARQAYHNSLHGRTLETLQNFRQQVLAVTLDDLQRVTETYLKSAEASTAVITSASVMDQVGDLGLDVIKL